MANISRRDFLKGVAAGAASLAICGAVGNAPDVYADGGTTSYDVRETKSADFVVVGSGMAGLSGAVQAAQYGLSVILLEKNTFLGGSTNVAEGVFGLGSQIQKDAGQSDALPSVAELLKETLEYHHYNANTTVIKHFYEESGANIDWLVEQGCPIEANAMPGMKNLRHGYIGKGGKSIAALAEKAENLGVVILTETCGKELIVKDGAVVGIYAEDKNGIIEINAKAVFLATGGYAGNPEMLVKYAHIASTEFVKDCGIPGRNGDGINMALAAGGAEWKHMGVLQNFGPILKNDTYASQLYSATAASGFRFNELGLRYADESLDVANFAFSGNIMQQQKASYSIATKAQIDEWATVGAPYGGGLFMVGLGPIPDLWDQLNKELESEDPQVFECKELDQVAAKAEVDAETLKSSVKRYNELCKAGFDEDFLKAPEWLNPVSDEGPYYLFKHCIGIFTTCDGVHVNENAQVLNSDGEPVPGLFAGGMDAGGLMGDAYDVAVAPTSTQGWCVFCGRSAAKYVAENMV